MKNALSDLGHGDVQHKREDTDSQTTPSPTTPSPTTPSPTAPPVTTTSTTSSEEIPSPFATPVVTTLPFNITVPDPLNTTIGPTISAVAIVTYNQTSPLTTSILPQYTCTPSGYPTNCSNLSGGAEADINCSDLSGGAIAGISIACAVVGALVGVGALFLLMKKHRSALTSAWGYPGQSRAKQTGNLNSTLRQKRSDRVRSGPIERSVEEVTVNNVLEQPKDDATIKQTVAALFKAIEDHAENYYVDTKSSIGQPAKEVEARSNKLPSGITMQSDVDFELLLADHYSRSSAITSLITAEVLDSIDFFGVPETSLLPEMVTSFLRSSAPQVKDNHRSRLTVSRWRTSTASLLTNEDSPQSKARSQIVIDSLVANLDSILASYINPETGKDRRQHLTKICKRAQELGFLLLSQPAQWIFRWSDPHKTVPQMQRSEKGKRFVVQPQLRRTTDNVARKLDRPVVVLEWQLLQ